MIKMFTQGVIAALMVADTNAALTLLQDHQFVLLDPLSGATLQAEFLYYAIKKTNADVIKFLLNFGRGAGVDIPFFNFCGNTPIGLALEEDFKEVVPSLLSITDKNFALMMAVKLNHSSVVDLLLKTFAFKDKFLQFLGVSRNKIAVC